MTVTLAAQLNDGINPLFFLVMTSIILPHLTVAYRLVSYLITERTMNKSTILVVDDDRSIVKVVRSYLEQAGFTVRVAYDGESALHQLRSEKPDLLVLDLMLPDRDGWEITIMVPNN